MSLTVEDGTGVTGANTYFSLASATEYFSDRGVTTWLEGAETDKSAALIKACHYMETLDWKGTKTYSDNPLEWPRVGVPDRNGWAIDYNEIPRDIKWGQCEIAYRYFSGSDMLPDLERGGAVVREKVVDAIEVQYASWADGNTKFQYVTAVLRPYLNSIGSKVMLIRA